MQYAIYQTCLVLKVAETTCCQCRYRLERKDDGTIEFYYRGLDGQTKSMNCGLVLFGTGRKPIVQNMGLEVGPSPVVILKALAYPIL